MRFFQKNHGIITVLVTMIMVPVVVFIGVFVDLARYKLCNSQAVMAADAYGETVLGEYDNVLKELYGLFSITQNEEGLQAIKDLSKYTSYSFNPAADEEFTLEGFMPYAGAEVQFEYKPVDSASLSNHNVLLTQISDFMQYRVIEEILNETGVLGSLEQFSSLEADMDTMSNISNISTNSADALGEIDTYYNILKSINAYPDYWTSLEEKYQKYRKKLADICGSREYEAYIYYLNNKAEIDEAVAKQERINQAKSAEESKEDSNEESKEESTKATTDETMSAEEQQLASKYVDVEDYKKGIDRDLTSLSKVARNYDGTIINFDNADNQIDALGESADKLYDTINEIHAQIEELKIGLENCSAEVREGINSEIKELEDIAKMADDFQATYKLIQPDNDNKKKNAMNKSNIENAIDNLDEFKGKLIAGDAKPGSSSGVTSISFDWYDFQKDKSEFYSELTALCAGLSDTGDNKAADKKIAAAEKATRKAQGDIKDEDSKARDISVTLASELKVAESNDIKVPNFTDYFSGGISFNGIASTAIDRFLLASYDFGMFSSRVSGIEEPQEDETAIGGVEDIAEDGAIEGIAEDIAIEDAVADDGIEDDQESNTDEEYVDYSLTNVTMSRDINYLYGAELEYLFGGHNDSDDNLNETRNIICGVRMAMNFVSTYTIKEVDAAIKAAADAAAAAVAATGIGAAAAPLVRVAVSGALRIAVSTLETVEDWKLLKDRESVLLLKRNLDELSCADDIKELIGLESTSSEHKKSIGIKLSYEDYLYILMYLFVDTDTLLSRTSTLITLNVNQSQYKEEKLTTLDFKIENTVTAILSTCKVKMDFVVVPDKFMEIYLSGTSTENVINSIEDRYVGYSIIRGY